MIEAQTQKARDADVTGYDPANPQSAPNLMSDEQRQSLHLDDVDGYMRTFISGSSIRVATNTTRFGTK